MSKYFLYISLFTAFCLFTVTCKKDDSSKKPGLLQLVKTTIGTVTVNPQGINNNIPVDTSFVIEFSNVIDTNTVKKNIYLINKENNDIEFDIKFVDEYKTVILITRQPLHNYTNYSLKIGSGLKGYKGESFSGVIYTFTTKIGKIVVENITLNGLNFLPQLKIQNIDFKKINVVITFSDSLDATNYKSFFILTGNINISCTISPDSKKVTITNLDNLKGYTRYYLNISSNLKSMKGYEFDGFSNSFYTAVDSTPKFPLISDDDLLTLVQKQTFKYFWDFAHPSSGMTRERNTSGDIVTTGGSGFGVMSIIVGIERGFITRSDGLTRLDKILGFLETCDRFHGVWPHWMNGTTGKVNPFGPNDDGSDLVETSYMVQGLLTIRQYLDSTVSGEKPLVNRINTLCKAVEYDWYTRGENVLYWNWSPNSGWAVNVKIQGYNETLITYVMAATSVTHPISSDVYKFGYAKNGSIVNGNSYYGYLLPLGEAYGGPLFFTHYSYLGLDPRNLKDKYANYWQQNVNQSLINWAYCKANPRNYVGYSSNSWGLTASDNQSGYSAHSPTNDLGVITPTAAISALPYAPEQSMNAIRYFYYTLGDKLWGEYGFYDAYNVTEGWWANSYLAIDQGPIICMIENHRTGLLWNLFMSAPEVKKGLDKLGFTY